MTDTINRPHLNGPLNVAALELNISLLDKAANLSAAAAAIEALTPGIDIAVLPEMFSTGYILDGEKVRALAERNDGETMTWVRSQAARCNVAIVGSFIATDGERFFNRAFFVEPSGETTYYDKHHLFATGGEDSVYTAGDARIPTVRFRGWNVAFAVCYDLRFPVWLRNVDSAYDLLIVVANWPDARAYAWRQLLIARAIENQAYVVGCNRSGSDDFGKYSGTSVVVDAKGRVTEAKKSATADVECVVAELSRAALDDFRCKFPVCLHGDRFTLV
jgi:predicted amidohydrolase